MNPLAIAPGLKIVIYYRPTTEARRKILISFQKTGSVTDILQPVIIVLVVSISCYSGPTQELSLSYVWQPTFKDHDLNDMWFPQNVAICHIVLKIQPKISR